MMVFCETQSCARWWTITGLIDEFNEIGGLVDRLLLILGVKGYIDAKERLKRMEEKFAKVLVDEIGQNHVEYKVRNQYRINWFCERKHC